MKELVKNLRIVVATALLIPALSHAQNGYSKENELKNKKLQEINTLTENKTKLDSELSEPQKEYQEYLEKIKLWDIKNSELTNEKTIIEKEINFSNRAFLRLTS